MGNKILFLVNVAISKKQTAQHNKSNFSYLFLQDLQIQWVPIPKSLVLQINKSSFLQL